MIEWVELKTSECGGYILPSNLVEELSEHLLSHEDDIANGYNDFGDLKNLFEAIFGRASEVRN